MEAQAEHIHEELIRQCLQGNSIAYQRIYKLYSRSMYNVGYRIVNNADEAEDVLRRPSLVPSKVYTITGVTLLLEHGSSVL